VVRSERVAQLTARLGLLAAGASPPSFVWPVGATQAGGLTAHSTCCLVCSLATQVNERRIYLVLLHATVGIHAAVEHLVTSKSRVSFDADSTVSRHTSNREDRIDAQADDCLPLQAAIPARLTAKASGRVKAVVRSTLMVNSTFFVAYNLLRRPVLRAFLKHFGGQWAL
jgi:hypothetical protein